MNHDTIEIEKITGYVKRLPFRNYHSLRPKTVKYLELMEKCNLL